MQLKYYKESEAFEVSGKNLELLRGDTLVMCEDIGDEDYESAEFLLDIGEILNVEVIGVVKLAPDVYIVETKEQINALLRLKLRVQGFNIYWGNNFIDNNKVEEEGEL